MNCFFNKRSRSANAGLLLGQCNRRQDNINIHCGVPGVFVSGSDQVTKLSVLLMSSPVVFSGSVQSEL